MDINDRSDPKPVTLPQTGQLDADTAKRLFTSAIQIGDRCSELAARRLAVVQSLLELTNAAAGYWSWGHGNGGDDTVMPVAIIPAGFTESQMFNFVKFAMAPGAHTEIVQPIKHMKGSKSQIAVARSDLYDLQTWRDTFSCKALSQIGFDEWLQCVRYSCDQNWSQLFLLRENGQPPFSPADRSLIDLAMSSVGWLHASAAETLSAEELFGLTARQRAVMLMMLDGHSRKQIASHFGIGEQTVGDHIKQIYRHFDINSLGELAAIFLRAK